MARVGQLVLLVVVSALVLVAGLLAGAAVLVFSMSSPLYAIGAGALVLALVSAAAGWRLGAWRTRRYWSRRMSTVLEGSIRINEEIQRGTANARARMLALHAQDGRPF